MKASRGALAYVVNALNAGGTEKLVVEMSQAFAAEYDIEVICLDEPGIWAEELRQRGIKVSCLWRQPGLDLSIPLKLARLLRQSGAAIVHAHQCTPWFYAALARILHRGPRVLLEEHGRFFPEVRNRKRAFVNRHLIRHLTHRFIAVSHDIRERLVNYEGLDQQQIEVIYNGVIPPRQLDNSTRAALRAKLGFSPEDFVVGAIGRFDSIKNLPMLIEALSTVRSRSIRIKGLLVGDGPMFADVSKLIRERSLEHVIKLTGYRSDARELMQCLDLYVLCSFSEGTSMALLEALAAGVAPVVTNVGGNPEIVEAERTGWVVPSNDVAALAAAIDQAHIDTNLRARFAVAGQKRFHERFAFERMIAEYRRQYVTLWPPQIGAHRAHEGV